MFDYLTPKYIKGTNMAFPGFEEGSRRRRRVLEHVQIESLVRTGAHQAPTSGL